MWWSLLNWFIKFTPLRAVHNESSQYLLNSEINDRVQRSLIVRQVNVGKIARLVEHNQRSATEGQKNEGVQLDLGSNAYEDPENWTLSPNTNFRCGASNEDVKWLLMLNLKACHFFSQVSFPNLLLELLSPLSNECLLWLRANRTWKRAWEKRRRGGQSTTPQSLKGPPGHILRRLEGEYSSI